MVVGCQPYAPATFTPRKYSWYSFLLEAESTPGPYCDRKDFMSMKNPLTPAGVEPATFRIVAQHLNHCATAVPRTTIDLDQFKSKPSCLPGAIWRYRLSAWCPASVPSKIVMQLAGLSQYLWKWFHCSVPWLSYTIIVLFYAQLYHINMLSPSETVTAL